MSLKTICKRSYSQKLCTAYALATYYSEFVSSSAFLCNSVHLNPKSSFCFRSKCNPN